jgi:hypothetical protein
VSVSAILRAPTDDGGVLVDPPFHEVGAILAENRRRLASNIPILDRPLSVLQARARAEALGQAREYLAMSGEEPPSFQAAAFLMAGHQPELFHPGVWVKNFALNGLARQHGLTPLNLVVDNDIVKNTTLQVPALGDTPHVAKESFDVWREQIPYEERGVFDNDLFDSLPERVEAISIRWPWRPMLHEFWKRVPRPMPNLGARFVFGRRLVERAWGCHNLEVPVSRLCRTEAFACFACHLLHELPRFHALHNEIVADYRLRNGIRNAQHPVPDLGRDGAWLEAPLWVWTSARPRRERLFARRAAGVIELRAGHDVMLALPCNRPEAWLEFEKQGYKVRCRALTTTLYARLLLADLFMHGIGGAKYDELTDTLIHRFYGVEPPRFLVLSATLMLPFPGFAVSDDLVDDLARARRDVLWNPQRHLAEVDFDADTRRAAVEKEAWIARPATTSGERRQRFMALRGWNSRLQPAFTGRAQQLSEEWQRSRRELEANAIMSRRDYSFCLYPADRLQKFFQRFLATA